MSTDGFLAEIVRSLGFLTRLPISQAWFAGQNGSLATNSRVFPLAGAVIALPAALALLVASLFNLPPAVASLIAIAVLAIVTGALHEDGLADVADGFFGGATEKQRLEIMKDSRIGTFGTLALVISVALRTLLLAAIVEHAGAGFAALALIGTEAASRAVLVQFWHMLPSVRPGGVADGAGIPDDSATYTALLAGFLILIVTYIPVGGIGSLLIAVLLCGAATFGFANLCTFKIGGQTGDTLGAAQQIAAVTLLTGLVMLM
ncbi:adenosylcobinamide-GDP ribazoletransferase [Phyllobacterium salinisoli]|uniref:Adenosylcobinamide-GDP ribazoletransferase n=1 Tax=Phyllobacterium salinisoli TaxID=1899321 RepID=A0A368K7I9_9HYPH|nr:adenosylcobinamide-GDP ribazoletransferase [Phyllobacterium salinisoli]RCS25319.1 adenosylcobinamide-GDP ribazoletransferase [Phyllobacterium salinisoli]